MTRILNVKLLEIKLIPPIFYSWKYGSSDCIFTHPLKDKKKQ